MISFEEQLIYIILYVLIWVYTLYAYQKRRKYYDAGSLLLTSYLVYSIFSLLLFVDPYPFSNRISGITFFPFVYLYVMLMIGAYPVFKYNELKIDNIQNPTSLYIRIIIILFCITSLVSLPSYVEKITSISDLFTNKDMGNQLYNESISRAKDSGSGISNLNAIISSALYDIGVLLMFFELTKKNANKIYIILLLMSLIIGILGIVFLGERGGVILKLYSILITYFAMKKFIQPRYKKIVKYVGIIAISLLILPVAAITLSRFGKNDDLTRSSLYYYIGQENLYFNKYGLDDNGIRYGDRVVPLFKKIAGFEDVPNNFVERRKKYPELKINDEVFSTYVGDFTIDFGPEIAFIIFVIFSILITEATKIRNKQILFHQLILLQMLMCICMQGGMVLFGHGDIAGNLKIIATLIAYFLFKFDYQTISKKQHIKIHNLA